ncbi:DsbA family protein, partial [Paracraurococcus lichenis]
LARVDREVCVARAGEASLGSAAFAAALGRPEIRDEQGATLRQALDRGAFGVPTIVVGNRLFWGNDQVVLLRHHLRRLLPGPSDGD